MASIGKTYIVEHLDDELGPWSKLEYMTIAKESHENGAKVYRSLHFLLHLALLTFSSSS